MLERALKRPISLVAPLLYTALLCSLSSVPGTIPDDAPATYRVVAWVPPAVQNLLHVPAYAGLAFLWRWSLVRRLRPASAILAALLLAVMYGLVEEWYQSFVPGRYATLTDVLFNSIGAFLGVVAFRWASWMVGQSSVDSG